MCTNDDSALLLHQSHKYIWAKHRLASRFVATHIAIARHKINDVGFLWRFLGFRESAVYLEGCDFQCE